MLIKRQRKEVVELIKYFNMKKVIYFLTQIVLITSFLYLAYLPTLKIDFFSWGNNKNDGLYLLVVPMILLPLLIVFSVLKYFVVKKAKVSIFFKWTFSFTIFIGILNTLIVSVSSSNGGLLAVTSISLAVSTFLLIEVIMFFRNFRPL